MDFYLGISYLKDNDESWTDAELRDWKEAHCPEGNHLWDEVLSTNGHYIICDACGLMLYISLKKNII